MADPTWTPTPSGGRVRDPFLKTADRTTWMVPHARLDEVEHRLRYTPTLVDEKDRMLAASVIESYRELIAKPRRRRDEIVLGIREAQEALNDGKG